MRRGKSVPNELGASVVVLGPEHQCPASPGSTVSVAAPRCLCDRVDPGKSAIDDGKVEIHLGLDQLCRNDTTSTTLRKLCSDLLEHLRSMFRAHQGTQMEMAGLVRTDGFE